MIDKEKKIWLENKKKEILASVTCYQEAEYAHAFCDGIDCAISLLDGKIPEVTKDNFIINKDKYGCLIAVLDEKGNVIEDYREGEK